MIKYQAHFATAEEGGYTVTFPDVPGCITEGDSLEQAMFMAKEALSLMLEEIRDPQWEVPHPKTRKGKNYHWISPEPYVGIPLMIRQKRLEAGLSQNQLARKLGISTQQLQKLETPGKSNPTVKTLSKLSQVLGASLEIDLVA